MDRRSIILAVGTPPGRSLRGIVRGSGPGALEILDAIVDGRAGRAHGRGVSRVRLRIPAPGVAALVLAMPGPRSATGDDTFELLLPGNPHLLDAVIDAITAIDPRARRAGPGEFSARAFLNGRLTLDGAEGIAALIRASSDAELDAAKRLASGAIGARAVAWSARVAELCARLEAGIDFTDQEDVVTIEPCVLALAIASVREEIDRSLGRRGGAAWRARDGGASPDPREFRDREFDGAFDHSALPTSARHPAWKPRVVLVGPPNAGKSTLFNALVGSKRAVASPIAGTTRDAIEAAVDLERGPAEGASPGAPSDGAIGRALGVMLVDLPGLDRSSADPLAPRLESAARRSLAEADLVIHCHAADVGGALPPEVEAALAGRPILRVRTKADLAAPAPPAAPQVRTETGTPPRVAASTDARTGRGLDGLRRAIVESLSLEAAALGGDAALLPRHRAALATAQECLDLARARAEHEPPRGPWRAPEEVAASLRLALDALGSITGATTSDDVLGLIFARFCIGK